MIKVEDNSAEPADPTKSADTVKSSNLLEVSSEPNLGKVWLANF